jgi:peptidyl-tRNA hydrolase, PTH1 family
VASLLQRLRRPSTEVTDRRAIDSWLIVGLGNPGQEYSANRHNVGRMVVDLLAERIGGRFKAHKARADVVEGRIGTTRVVLAKTRTYMNDSGSTVTALRDYYKVAPERIVAVHDELDLPYGDLRLKLGGGDNGHNGLKSLRRSLGTGEFTRVRLGIGRPPGRMDPAAFVLKDFGTAERKELPFHVDRAADAVEALVTDGLVRAQNEFNS